MPTLTDRDSVSSGREMPKCQNCGAHVTEQYVRVFVPDEIAQPRVCPHCPDKKRGQGSFSNKYDDD